MSHWVLSYEGFEPQQEGLREALCTLGNGYLGSRGAAAEAEADEIHYPGNYVAGCYNRLKTDISGRSVENEDLVNIPNWLPLTFRIAEGDWFSLQAVEIEDYRQELDMKAGLLSRSLRFRDAEGRWTRLASRRLVHIDQPHIAALALQLTPENWSGRLEIRSALDGRVTNAGVARYRSLNSRHLRTLASGRTADDVIYLETETVQSRVTIAQAARTQVRVDGGPAAIEAEIDDEAGAIAQRFALEAREGQRIEVEKVVAIHTSRDSAITEPGQASRSAVGRSGGFEDLAVSQAEGWKYLWDQFDMRVEPVSDAVDGHVLLILRLHIFHLLQTTSPNTMDLDVGVPARGLHGEAYRGHIFWDELFIFPLLNLRLPEVTRGLLKYRYRRLPEARAAAAAAGYKGAMYPWQSASNGREETQELHLNPKSGHWLPDNSRLQRHVNGAVAYNVWQYYQVTNDLEFLAYCGAEMLLEIARFWASLASYNEELERYEILGVVGPDEYHDGYPDADKPGVDNNAYTNVIAVWTLIRALETLELLSEDQRDKLLRRLKLDQDELDHWDKVSRRMRLVFHDGGVISQFERYEELEELDWEGLRRKHGDIQRLDRILEAENDTPNRYRASKQADVLMLFYLFSAGQLQSIFERLGYPFGPDTIGRNIDYYMHRTSHGSTLSRLVHAWVLARVDRARSWELLRGTLDSDISDIQGGTTKEGIHLGAMAGSVDLVQRCYAGLETRRGVIWFDPCLPDELRCLKLNVRYRGHFLAVTIEHESLQVEAVQCAAPTIEIRVRDEIHHLEANQTATFDLRTTEKVVA